MANVGELDVSAGRKLARIQAGDGWHRAVEVASDEEGRRGGIWRAVGDRWFARGGRGPLEAGRSRSPRIGAHGHGREQSETSGRQRREGRVPLRPTGGRPS